jgi:Na+-transporting NADH:ubiquinone oxidoreductase subunit A
MGTPQAVIVSTLSLEPFVARGDVLLGDHLVSFIRGLEHLQSLLEYQSIYLVVPDIRSAFALKVKPEIRGYAWVKQVEVPLTYPHDHFRILARQLDLKPEDGPVWAIKTEGILAMDQVLTNGQPYMQRTVAVGGPAATDPGHVMCVPGYPLQVIRDKYVPSSCNTRIICGGVFTGRRVDSSNLGLDIECTGLTLLPEHEQREFLGFVRPGASRACYAACYLSALRRPFAERLTTAVRGELRPCISCNFCEEVCPAGIMPHLIHKYLYSDLLQEAEQARVDLCVECGLCTYVCPSKIDLTGQFIEAKASIEKEKEEIRIEQERKERLRQQEAARAAGEKGL